MDGWSPSTLPPHAKLGLLCLVGLLVVWGALDLPGLGIGCKRQIGGWHRKCQVADPPPPKRPLGGSCLVVFLEGMLEHICGLPLNGRSLTIGSPAHFLLPHSETPSTGTNQQSGLTLIFFVNVSKMRLNLLLWSLLHKTFGNPMGRWAGGFGGGFASHLFLYSQGLICQSKFPFSAEGNGGVFPCELVRSFHRFHRFLVLCLGLSTKLEAGSPMSSWPIAPPRLPVVCERGSPTHPTSQGWGR